MTVVLAIVIGGLYGVAVYLMLRRNLAQLILGLALLTNAANLLIFTAGGLTRARPPLIPEGAMRPAGVIADPVPQSLILTSIVIGFGVLAFAMALAYRVDQAVPSDDLEAMITTDHSGTAAAEAAADLVSPTQEREPALAAPAGAAEGGASRR